MKIPRLLKTLLRISAGVVLVVVGLIGLLLPILPGWPFLIPGVMLLIADTRLKRKLVSKIDRLRQKRQARRIDGGGM